MTHYYTVTIHFKFPAWSERHGIDYYDVPAGSKSEANRIVRKWAERDGHLGYGKGRARFSAVQQDKERNPCN